MEKRFDVFISYSSQDQKVVEGLCGFLERKGYRCFVAYRDIPRGVVWATAITEAMDVSKMMVVIFSNAFNVSPQTDREIEIASENRMPILTYRVTDSEMTGAKKYYLKNLNWIDAFPNPEACFGQLLDSVVKLIGPSVLEAKQSAELVEDCLAQETTMKQSKPDQRRKRHIYPWIIGGVLITLIVLAFILVKSESNDSYNGHEYVDLGLPSGTLWATCNVGASKPEDYGDYYAWGEVQTKSTYDWATYKYAKGSDSTITKYCFASYLGYNGYIDKLRILQDTDDAATVNWGSGWYTPTFQQWTELLENTTNQWVSQDGVTGMLFTARRGKTLFLPASGYYSDDVYYMGGYGFYWSKSLSSSTGASGLYFISSDCHIGGGFRCGGHSVRPVRSARQN